MDLGWPEIFLILFFLVLLVVTIVVVVVFLRWVFNRNKNVNKNIVNVSNVISTAGSRNFCSKCGERLDARMEFCPKCGTKIDVSAETTRSS